MEILAVGRSVLYKGGFILALKDLFTKNQPKKKKYATIPTETAKSDVPEGIMTKCPSCKKIMYTKELLKNTKVCLHCGFHFQMNAKERIDSFIDEGSFVEINENMVSENPLNFPDYLEKLEKDRQKSKLNEAVVTGMGTVNGPKNCFGYYGCFFPYGEHGLCCW